MRYYPKYNHILFSKNSGFSNLPSTDFKHRLSVFLTAFICLKITSRGSGPELLDKKVNWNEKLTEIE